MRLTKSEVTKELFTIKDFIRWGITEFNKAQLFFGHGTDNPWDEAVLLISHVLNFSPDIDPRVIDARLTNKEKIQILEIFNKRIAKQIPAAYLTNEAWFADLPFYVDKRVLIPRSSIGELIQKHFAPWVDYNNVKRILDIGTGCGCIAVACAVAFSQAKVDAVDVSSSALEVAKKNVANYSLGKQITLIQSDVFASVPKGRYDIIISNPPYVSKAELKTIPKEYTHEPKVALDGGATGLDIVLKILKGASEYLSAHGILIIEVGNSESVLREMFPKIPFTWLEFEKGEGGVFLLTAEQLATIRF